MDYSERAPASDLARWVRCYWFLREPAHGHSLEQVLPDGSVEVIYQLGDPFAQKLAGRTFIQPPALVSAEIRRPTTIGPTGMTHVAAIRFRPGGAYPFFREPMSALVDRTGSIDELWPSTESLRARLADCSDDQARTEVFDAYLQRLLSDRLVDRRFDELAATVRARGGNLSISHLAMAAGLSAREVQRRFRERAGVGPKQFARIIRFRNGVRALSAMDDPIDRGYYDQSHFINEFRSFAGVSPRVWLAERHGLSDLFAS
jgi:AraC-like DNA-binding protein